MCELLSAVRAGREEKTSQLLGSETFYHLPSWNQGQGIVLLREALARGHCDIAKLLLSKGARVNNKFGNPINDPLHYAVCLPDNVDVVTLLMKEGAKINSTNADGCTPLHLAVFTNNETATKLLLECQATPDAEDNFRNTPLHVAAERGFSRLVELLLTYGAKPNTPLVNGFTPLHLACLHTRTDTVTVLLEHEADPNASSDEGTPLDLAFPGQEPINLLDQRVAIVTKLLKAGAQANGLSNTGKTVLHRAVERNCLEMVAATVRHSNVNAVSLDVSAKYLLSPIQIAAQSGYVEIGEMLISHGADFNMPCNTPLGGNYTPLHLACSFGHIDFVKLLLKYGADTEAKSLEGRTPLLAGICHFNGNVETLLSLVQFMVSSGASLMASDQEGTSVLHAAAQKPCLPLSRLILELNSDDRFVNNPTITGLTPLHMAAANGSIDVAEFLLSHGADINSVSKAPTSDGLTPLHVASKHAHMNVVKLFLSRGAEVNSLTSLNQTPAHVMLSNPENFKSRCLQNALSVLPILLENLADIDSTDKNGYTVLNLGVKLRCLPIVEIILRYKPNPRSTANSNSLKLAVFSGTNVSDDVFSDFSHNLRTSAVKEVKTIIQTLLDYGFVFNHQDVKDNIVLHHAIRKGLSNAVEHLLDRGADFGAPSEWGTPLHTAVKMLHVDMVKLLIIFGANVNATDESGKTPIFYVYEKPVRHNPDHVDSQLCANVARELLIGGADLSCDDKFLMIAVRKKDDELVKFALERNASIDVVESNGFTALHMAVHMEDESVVKLLLNHGVEIDAMDVIQQTPLLKAVSQRAESIANILLDKGAKVGVADCRGYTPLHHAACGCPQIIHRLIELGADTEARNNRSLTPLLLAAENGNGRAVVALLQGGSDPKARRPDDTTVLHLAAERTDGATVEAALYYGADVTARTSTGGTPLRSAVQACNHQTTKILLECGGYTAEMCCSLLRNNRWSIEVGGSIQLQDVLHLHFLSVEALQLWDKTCPRGCRTLFIRRLAKDFNAELTILKSKNLTKTMTFFDIISKPKRQLVSLARNETVAQALTKVDFTERFPTWGKLLSQRWTAAVTRVNLLSSGISSYNSLISAAVVNCITSTSKNTEFPVTLKRTGFGWILRVLRSEEVSNMSNEDFVRYLFRIQSLLPVAVVEKILGHLTDDELRHLETAALACKPFSLS